MVHRGDLVVHAGSFNCHPHYRPDAQAMSTLRHMVAEGRISDIKDWASALATRQPEWADFAQQVKTAAIHVDLAELENLIK